MTETSARNEYNYAHYQKALKALKDFQESRSEIEKPYSSSFTGQEIFISKGHFSKGHFSKGHFSKGHFSKV